MRGWGHAFWTDSHSDVMEMGTENNELEGEKKVDILPQCELQRSSEKMKKTKLKLGRPILRVAVTKTGWKIVSQGE